MADDFSLSSLERFMRLLNEDNNNAGVDIQQITLSNPQVVNQFSRNTKIQVTAKSGAGLTGTRAFYYNRLDLGTVFNTLVPDLTVYVSDYQTTLDLLPHILEQHGINLGPDDIRNTTASSGAVILTAKQNSIAWIGQVVLNVQPPTIALADLIISANITGFVYTGQTPSFAIADLFLDTADQILALINAASGTTLTSAQVSVGPPVAVAPDGMGRNTTVLLTALPNSGYSGTRTIKYTRLDIGVFIPDGFAITGSMDGVGSTHQVLQMLRDQHGVVLRNNEVVNEAIGVYPEDILMTIDSNSHVWAPGSQLFIEFPLGHILLLDNGNYFVMDNGNYLLLD